MRTRQRNNRTISSNLPCLFVIGQCAGDTIFLTIRRLHTLDSKDIAITCAKIADQKKAQNIIVLDVSKLTFFTRYFVICTGINQRQLHAISDEMAKELKKLSVEKLSSEGYREAKWILLDFGDVVVHLFGKEERNYYELELLWGDAPRIEW
ncbi:MAG: ribosome silencing factor [Candidatus Scalindua sp.]|nr:ribosome silencing factor [Candidatus Scalindua sp.]